VANVALPHIAGNLSASTDESTWVLTSYLVSNAIMLPAAGWIARRIGRKRLLMLSIVVFTAASLLCGMALTMPMLIVARVLQGIGGGGMQPLAQSILLESFPPRQHGTAMAVYGVGVIVAPCHRPRHLADGSPTATPGAGFSTSIFPWACWRFHGQPLRRRPALSAPGIQGAIDYSALACWLSGWALCNSCWTRGREADWFAAPWVCWTAAISTAALVAFIIRELTDHEPIVQLRILLDRNFAVGTLITCTYGFVLYGVTAMLPLFLQTLLGYSALQSGLSVSPRGIGSMASMIAVGLLVRYIDGRWLMCFGFGLPRRLHMDAGPGQPADRHVLVVLPNLVNGFAMGFIWVSAHHHDAEPLRKQDMGNATASTI